MPPTQYVGTNYFCASGGITEVCLCEFANRVFAEWQRFAILLPFTGRWLHEMLYSGANCQRMFLDEIYTSEYGRAKLTLLAKECWRHFEPLPDKIALEHFSTGIASEMYGSFGPVTKEPLLAIFRNVAWLIEPHDPAAGHCGNERSTDFDMSIRSEDLID